MTRTHLIIRNLWHFRAGNLAVLAGVAVATAVLTGALTVGDSVRESLRKLALRRLGDVDYALVSPRAFPQNTASRLAKSKPFQDRFEQCVSGFLLRGGAMDESQQRVTGQTQIAALSDWVDVPPGACILNGPVADAIGNPRPGATIFLTFPSVDPMPRDAILARRGREDVRGLLRLTVSSIAPEGQFASLFSLTGGQRTPRNAWVNLADLQIELDQPRRVNMLLVKSRDRSSNAAGADVLNAALRELVTLRDYGLVERAGNNGETVLESETTYLPAAVESAAQRIAKDAGMPLRRVSAYLVNRIEGVTTGSVLHYAAIAGISGLDDGPIASDEIVLNQWAAAQMKLASGDRVRLTYYKRQADGQLKEVPCPLEFVYRGRTVDMAGLGGDKTLTPQYKGITDKDSVGDWKKPQGMQIDPKLADDPYWRKYKAAPKFFINLETARQLWGGVYGDINSVRVPADRAEQFMRELLRNLSPADFGLAFTPAKGAQLAAASGGTDFSMLFLGFSFFIIAAAAMLVAMLLRLGIEQRSRQFGLMSALGFAPPTLRRMALAEGLFLAGAGALVGLAAALGYTWLMIYALRTWWIGAVGTTALSLYPRATTLAVGFLASTAVAGAAILRAVWRLGRAQPSMLLAGGWGRSVAFPGQRSRIARLIAAAALAVGLIVLVAAALAKLPQQIAFLAGGAALLLSSLAFIGSRWAGAVRSSESRRMSLRALGVRNAARNVSRSLTTVSLVALAVFVLVTVSSMKQRPPADSHDRKSGTGGYQLILQTDVPLSGDLNSAAGRDLVGIRRDAEPIISRARYTGMRSWAGQDVSCLNLTRPGSPTILAVPDEMMQQNRFTFARSIRKSDNPWNLLKEPAADAVPVITDEETAQYILELDIGQTIQITDQLGRTQNLKLVATLAHSIFQSEMLMAEDSFRRLFPSQSGYGVVLVETPDNDLPGLREALASELKDFAPTLDKTTTWLARYQEVANTYLSTFQALGSLGLMLGTAGLAVVLLRTLAERRGELALLSAIGFAPGARLRLVMSENVLLLALGLGVGAICALVGIWPAVSASARAINWLQLAVTLLAVIIIGLFAMGMALVIGGRRLSLADLRNE